MRSCPGNLYEPYGTHNIRATHLNAMRLKGKVLDTTIHTYLGAHKGSVKAGKGILQGLGSPVSEFRAYRVWVKEL